MPGDSWLREGGKSRDQVSRLTFAIPQELEDSATCRVRNRAEYSVAPELALLPQCATTKKTSMAAG